MFCSLAANDLLSSRMNTRKLRIATGNMKPPSISRMYSSIVINAIIRIIMSRPTPRYVLLPLLSNTSQNLPAHAAPSTMLLPISSPRTSAASHKRLGYAFGLCLSPCHSPYPLPHLLHGHGHGRGHGRGHDRDVSSLSCRFCSHQPVVPSRRRVHRHCRCCLRSPTRRPRIRLPRAGGDIYSTLIAQFMLAYA